MWLTRKKRKDFKEIHHRRLCKKQGIRGGLLAAALLAAALTAGGCSWAESPASAGSGGAAGKFTEEQTGAESDADEFSDNEPAGNKPAEKEPAGDKSPASQLPSSQSPWAQRIGTSEDDYILPDSGEHVYTRNELSGLGEAELRLARNEIYAVHGRKFTSPDLQKHFESKDWYQGEVAAEDFDSGVLNETELANLKLLLELEKEKKGGPIHVPAVSIQEFPTIDGSTATLPLSYALYRLCTGADEQEAEAAIYHGKTSSAWVSLMSNVRDPYDGGTELVIAYEPSEALKADLDALGDRVEIKPIGRDALVFMANQSNPLSGLTAGQIVDIYSGRIKNWREAGGEDQEILAFQRPENSGSQNLMEKLVMKDTAMAEAPSEFVVQEMGELLEEVSAYDNTGNAVGYSVYYYASNMYERPELKFMAVDGVMPDRSSIREGSYPFVNDFYAAIPSYLSEDHPARILYEWLTSEDGQGLINGLGYVGVSDAAREIGLEDGDDFEGELPLPEGKVILASGRYLFGESGVAVLDGKLRLLDFIRYASLDGLGTFREADADAELALMDTRTMLGRTYSLKERRWVEKGEQSGPTEDSIYELAYSFSDNHPEILAAHGCKPEDVQVFYASDAAPPVMLLTQGRTEHYYTALGEYMFSYERRPREEENNFWRAPYQVDSQVSYLQVFDEGEDYVLLYHEGKQIKKLEDDTRGRIGTVGHWFYTRLSGNYVYIYNYDDQACGKFLTGLED